MRALSELAGKDLLWTGDVSPVIPRTYERHFVLYDQQEPCVEVQVMWQVMVFFDLIMEAGEGTYQVHMDLADPHRQSVAWKTGEPQSIAGFQVESESIVTCEGWITTAAGRKLAVAPTHQMGYEYVVYPPGGARLITASIAANVSIGGNPGHMLLAPETAWDSELPALVALAFAISNEQTRLLHRAAMWNS
jgi:hypothetical protein